MDWPGVDVFRPAPGYLFNEEVIYNNIAVIVFFGDPKISSRIGEHPAVMQCMMHSGGQKAKGTGNH